MSVTPTNDRTFRLPESWNSVITETIDRNVDEIRRAEDNLFMAAMASVSASWSPPRGLSTTYASIDDDNWITTDLTWNLKSSPKLDRRKIIKELKQWREALRLTDVDKIVIKTKHHKVTIAFKEH